MKERGRESMIGEGSIMQGGGQSGVGRAAEKTRVRGGGDDLHYLKHARGRDTAMA